MGRAKARRGRYAGNVQKTVPSTVQGNRSNVPAKTYGILDALQVGTGHTPYGDIRLFPRDTRDNNAFGPGFPLPAEPLDAAALGSGQPAPRIWQYPVSWNLPGGGNREVPWQVLRAAAGSVDIIRQCIEQRKREMRGLKWRWSVSTQAVQDAYAADPKRGRDDAENALREKYLPEINRLTDFWERPWKSNGWDFGQWLNAIMEEMIVLDALPIYPRRALAGNVLDLEVVDGSTIKPLLDVQGRRPSPPYAAFQQELYGFPRGEYRASGAEVDEAGNIVQLPGGLSSAELIYHVENVRTHSPYGLSQVENALISARLYLKRQGWMLAEYEDGSTPLTWIAPPENPATSEQFTPTTRRQWEDSMNAELSGDTRRRARAKVLPPGWTATQTQSVDERYKPEYDIHLIKLVCAHLQTPIAKLGYSEAKGLGTTGYHEGMSSVSDAVGQRPDQEVISSLVQRISRDVLDAPRELEFQFIDPAAEDTAAANTVQDSQFRRGVITLNDSRRAIGQALYDFPEADMPMIVGVGPSGVVFLEGLAAQQAAQNQMTLLTQQSSIQASADEATAASNETSAPADDSGDAADDSGDAAKAIMPDQAALIRDEIRAYRRWISRRGDGVARPVRPFAFKHATPDDLYHDDYRLEELATFEGWIWVPEEDVTLFVEADLVKGDGWRKLARDSRGRWMKLGSLRDVELGPDKPHENVLERLRREAHGRVNGRSSSLPSMHTRDQRKAFVQQHKDMTREQFDALPAAERERLLSDLRTVAAAPDTFSRRDNMGILVRGQESQHVSDAKFLVHRFTRAHEVQTPKPHPVQSRIDGIDALGEYGDAEGVLGGATREELVAIGNHYGVDTKELEQNKVKLGYGRKDLANRIMNHRRATAVSPDAQRGTPESPAGRAFGVLSENAGWAGTPEERAAAPVPKPRREMGESGGHRDLTGHPAAAVTLPPDAQRGTPESPAGRAFGSLSENAGWADGAGESGGEMGTGWSKARRNLDRSRAARSVQNAHVADLKARGDTGPTGPGAVTLPPDAQRGTPESPAGRAFGSLSENAGWADEKPSARIREGRREPVAEGAPFESGAHRDLSQAGVRPAAASDTPAGRRIAAMRATASREELNAYTAGLSKSDLREVVSEYGIPVRSNATRADLEAAVRGQFGVRFTDQAIMGQRTAVETSLAGRAPASAAGVGEAFRQHGGTPYRPVSAAAVLAGIGGTKRQRESLVERMFRDRDLHLTAPDETDPVALLERVRNGDPSVMMSVPSSDEGVLGKA